MTVALMPLWSAPNTDEEAMAVDSQEVQAEESGLKSRQGSPNFDDSDRDFLLQECERGMRAPCGMLHRDIRMCHLVLESG
jgi:hypothetical protein